MRQQSLADGSFEKYRKKTRKEVFLDEMDQIIPWQDLTAVIKPFYPEPKGAGRRPKGIERMLRIHFLQHWFELSDPAAEEALYDSRAMRQFVGIDLGQEPVPDETTICKFRHLMERHNLGDELFRLVNVYLDENGLKLGQKEVLCEYAPNARDFTQKKGSRHRSLSAEERSRNRTKSKVRAKVEHVFHVMKRQFGYTKVRYRGLDKNAHHLFIKCALVNLVLSKRRLLRLAQV